MSYPRYNTMSYPNQLRYPQSRAGLYAMSNCYNGLLVNVDPVPHVIVPSFAETSLSLANQKSACTSAQFSQGCTTYMSSMNGQNPGKFSCQQNLPKSGDCKI